MAQNYRPEHVESSTAIPLPSVIVPSKVGRRVKHFKAIAAMSENRVIGRGNQIPWHLPEDFKWFKKRTTGHILIMGRKTFESIGKPLPGRETIVLSRSGFHFPGVRVVRELSELDPASEPGRDMFICGGARVYEKALPLCSDLYLTLVKRTVDGDVFFPRFEDLFERLGIIQETSDFQIAHYGSLRLEGELNPCVPPQAGDDGVAAKK